MTSINDSIIVSADSDTILFENHTPERAYDILTNAVYSARFQPDYVRINIEQIPPHTKIGTAKYSVESDTISNINIDDLILEDYGVKK